MNTIDEKDFKEKFLSCDEVAAILGVTGNTIRIFCRTRKLTYLQIGGQKKIPLSEVKKFQENALVCADC